MSDLIERQAAIDAINDHFGFNVEEEYGSAVQEVINGLPSAEPEIIRCKDCKHWYSDADTGMACEFTNMSQPDDGFCNWAEMGTNDERFNQQTRF